MAKSVRTTRVTTDTRRRAAGKALSGSSKAIRITRGQQKAILANGTGTSSKKS